MTVTSDPDVYYDPYDFAIDADPYPVWKRLRDEAPLYYNEKHDFYVLSRLDDVDAACSTGRRTSRVRARCSSSSSPGMEFPPGIHPLRRPAAARSAPRPPLPGVHARRRWQAIEPQVRTSAPDALDPLVGPGGFDFIARPGRRACRCGSSACCSASPRMIRRRFGTASTRACGSTTACRPTPTYGGSCPVASGFADYVDWRAEHPSDDLMTELLNAEFEDDDGHHQHADP